MSQDPDLDGLEELMANIKKDTKATALTLEQIEQKLKGKRKGSKPDPRLKRIGSALIALKREADAVSARLDEVDHTLEERRESSKDVSLENIEGTLATLKLDTHVTANKLGAVNDRLHAKKSNMSSEGGGMDRITRLEANIEDLKEDTRALSAKLNVMCTMLENRSNSDLEPRLKSVEDDLSKIQQEVDSKLEDVANHVAKTELETDPKSRILDMLEEDLEALKELATCRLNEVERQLLQLRDGTDLGSQSYRLERIEAELAAHKEDTANRLEELGQQLHKEPIQPSDDVECRIAILEEETARKLEVLDSGLECRLQRLEENLKAFKEETCDRLKDTDLHDPEQTGQINLDGLREELAVAMEALAHRLLEDWSGERSCRLDKIDAEMGALKDETTCRLEDVDRKLVKLRELLERSPQWSAKKSADSTKTIQEGIPARKSTLLVQIQDEKQTAAEVVDPDAGKTTVANEFTEEQIVENTSVETTEVVEPVAEERPEVTDAAAEETVEAAESDDGETVEAVESDGGETVEAVESEDGETVEVVEPAAEEADEPVAAEPTSPRSTEPAPKAPQPAATTVWSEGGKSSVYVIDDVMQTQLTLTERLKRSKLHDGIIGRLPEKGKGSDLDLALARVRATIAATEHKLEETERLRDRTIAYLRRLDDAMITASEYAWLARHGVKDVPPKSRLLKDAKKTSGSVANPAKRKNSRPKQVKIAPPLKATR